MIALVPDIGRQVVPGKRQASRRAKLVQAHADSGGGSLAQLSCFETTCGIWDAGAIPAASILRFHKSFFCMIYVYARRGLVSRRFAFATIRTSIL